MHPLSRKASLTSSSNRMHILVLAAFLAVAHGVALDRFDVIESMSMWPDNHYQRIENSTPEQCAEKCLAGSFSGCKSFRYKTDHQKCDLLAITPGGVNVLTASSQGWDFYTMRAEDTAPKVIEALDSFEVIESMSMWPDNNYQRIENSTPEQCAAKCLAGSFLGCKSFRYKTDHQKCDLLVIAPGGVNVLTASSRGWDFYTMRAEDTAPKVVAALESFEFTQSMAMWPDDHYQRIENSTPEQCAEKCLAGSLPGCKSFRYKTEHRKCDLLTISPDGVNVLSVSVHGWDFYNLIVEKPALDSFEFTKGMSIWPDNHYQRIESSTQEQCAEKCLEVSLPGCKSFRYKTEHQKCDLLTISPDDVNVLTAAVHGWDFYNLIVEKSALDSFDFTEGMCIWPDDHYQRIESSTQEQCAEKCLSGSYPNCKSFRYKTEHQKCDLLTIAPDDVNVLTAAVHGWDFYNLIVETPALDSFDFTQGMSIWPDDHYQRIESSTQEQCAEKCLSGSYPNCKSFRYKTEHRKCDLLTIAPDDVNVLTAAVHGWDFYNLIVEKPAPEAIEVKPYTVCESGSLSSDFCHYGATAMRDCFNKPKTAIFKNSFLEAPAVSWGINHADLDHYRNTRVDISQLELDETQLVLQFSCWHDSHCYKVGVAWMACGLVSGN